ncbi:MAG: hypothetical protein R3Y10_07340 [Ferrimonas sp.]
MAEINRTPEELDAELLKMSTIPGYQVELTPEEAESLGAFFEDAISEEDLMASIPFQTPEDIAAYYDAEEAAEAELARTKQAEATDEQK